jgi:RimJ/RimL family protein N-acetyltransferase
MSSSLSTATLHIVEHLWEDRMRAHEGALSSSEVSFVEWPGFTAAVVVDIGEFVLVAGPAAAIERLRELPRDGLTDTGAAGDALGDLRPRLVGQALLAYADKSTYTPALAAFTVRQADRGEVEQAVSRCEPEDCDESGLLEMSTWFVAKDEGVPVAAAGYERWPRSVAHCGVAVGAEHRGRGLGQAVASDAVGHALGEHPVAQWRSRDTNVASTRIGARLGFVLMGTQTAFELHT